MQTTTSASMMLLFWMAVAATSASAQDGAEKDDDRATNVQQHWLDLSRKYAEAFTLTGIEDEGAKPFLLHEKPIFLHTQSVRGDDIGAVHLWLTEDKRPAVVGAVFAWSNSKNSRMVMYEFHSLVHQPISLKTSDRVPWTSRTRGFEWKSFPEGAPTPAEKPLRHRLRVKQLARRFTANTTTDKNQRWELRLVPTPIFEYQSESAGVDYGALFAFCQGTDTELLLLIEACHNPERDSEDQSSRRWRYGLAPFSDYKIRAELDREEVWESPQATAGENGKPHFWGAIEQLPKPDFEMIKD